MPERKECPKCRYIRQPSDTAHAWECPNCGIVYDKYLAEQQGAERAKPMSTATPQRRGNRFKALRVFILSVILVLVGVDAWLTKVRSTSWDHPLRVVVYPINADGSEAADKAIDQLQASQFDDIAQTLQREAARYNVASDDLMDFDLAPPVKESPPLPPRHGNVIDIMWWSLKLRWWAKHVDDYKGPTPEIRAFTLFYDPKTHNRLEDSTGLTKGMIGIIKLFASPRMHGQNNMVMLHELLHTLGATDKYDLRTDQPIYPDGYAEPDLDPLLPQHTAEIMAGRIPIKKNEAEIPHDLSQVVIGPKTAREIGWIK